ncbi:MAG: hypothetical protein FD143_3080 [Ignavibacteria bacterium]|nr:MAG: hypothetical protein FD143_3080 [Ignavibacteria bacterium]KAF0154474.1 MAG: hypothetical protein FD188_3256 [Ignavibacteria bacterium]
MKNSSIYIFSVILLLFVGCKSNTIKVDKEKLLKFADNRTKKIINAEKLSDISVLKKIIDLEETDNSLIGTIEDIYLVPEENCIIILNETTKRNILLFDYNGKFIRKIGNEGKGPGEYINPRPILYANNKLIVYSQNQKLLFFSLSGLLLNEITFSEKKWNFTIDYMTYYKNDLYAYTNNLPFLSSGDKGFRVCRLSNSTEFDGSFGEVEETFDFRAGDITCFKNKIIFSGVFDGNIYKINPTTDECTVFTSFGELYDIENIRKSPDKMNFFRKNINELNAFLKLAVIDSFLFVITQKYISVVDSIGNIINANIKNEIYFPQGFEGNAMRLSCIYYNRGFIKASVRKSRITSIFTPNPSLIIYEFKFE